MTTPLPTRFLWSGKNAAGQKVSGESEAQDVNTLQRLLYGQGIVLSASRKVRPVTKRVVRQKIAAADISIFLRQCAGLLQAGLPLVQSLEICIDSCRGTTLKTELQRIREQLDGGASFSSALRSSRLARDRLLLNLIHAAEQSGTLDDMMEKLATDSEKAQILRARVKKALMYPLAVLVVAAVVSALLLVKVVPQFAQTFSELGGELPALTRSVLALSDFLAQHIYLLVLLASLLVATLAGCLRRFAWARLFKDRMVRQLPVVGAIVQDACIARFCGTLSGSIKAGVPLVQALQTSAGATGNLVYENACMELAELVNQGQTLSFGVRKAACFPVMIGQLIHAGEQSGTLDQMLENCAIRYEQSVDQSVDKLSSLIEPVIMSVLGIIVATLLLAMYLPVFRLGSVL